MLHVINTLLKIRNRRWIDQLNTVLGCEIANNKKQLWFFGCTIAILCAVLEVKQRRKCKFYIFFDDMSPSLFLSFSNHGRARLLMKIWAGTVSCIWVITENWSIRANEDPFVNSVGEFDNMVQEFDKHKSQLLLFLFEPWLCFSDFQ